MSGRVKGLVAHLAMGLVVVLLVQGCAPNLARMNTRAPVEKRSVFLGTGYYQDGELLDRGDMLDKLERQPGPADELSGYDALAFFGMLLGGAGGALIGIPIGLAISGEDDPPWVLAGIGAGLAVIALPLGFIADAKVESAVDLHNARFAASDDVPIGRPGVPGARVQPPAAAHGTGGATGGRAGAMVREVIDLAHGVRLELLGKPAEYGANVALRFSRPVPADGQGWQACQQGTMRFGQTFQSIAPPTYKRSQAGAAPRENLQTIVPFALFEDMVASGQVDFDLCGVQASLGGPLMLGAKRFNVRFRQSLGSAPQPVPAGQPAPVAPPSPASVQPDGAQSAPEASTPPSASPAPGPAPAPAEPGQQVTPAPAVPAIPASPAAPTP